MDRRAARPTTLSQCHCSALSQAPFEYKVVCPLTSGGEHGRKGAFVAFGNTEAFYRNMVEGHGPYREEGEGGEGEGEGEGGECEGYGGEGMEGERKSKGERGQGTGRWHTRGDRVVGGVVFGRRRRCC